MSLMSKRSVRWLAGVVRKEKGADKTSDRSRGIVGSSTQIWKSRLSWRITLAVFLTILTVQVGIMSVTVKNYEQEKLNELVDSGRASVVPMISEGIRDMLESPITINEAHRLTTTTRIRGLAIYSRTDLNLLGVYGDPVVSNILNSGSIPSSYRSTDGGLMFRGACNPILNKLF